MASSDIISGKHFKLQAAFEEAFMAALAPIEAAMFEHDKSYDEYRYYFSPDAVKFFSSALETYGATECNAPPRKDTSLLVANSEAWDLLSSDANSKG
jgi:hypothetical protein